MGRSRLAVFLGAVVVAAGIWVPPPASLAAAAPPATKCSAAASTEGEAAQIAKACNRKVEVSSATTDRARVVASPSGLLEREEYAVPVRVRRSGGWVPVDTGLQILPGGRVAPRASTVDVRFSRGGTDALVSLSAAGGTVTVSWPSVLPAPVVDGDTAVYANVFPDVDLRVRATATGYTHVLEVKTAAAAAEPALRAIRYGWSVQGLVARPRANGGLDFADRSGQVVATAAPAMMWDSAEGAGAAGAGPGTPGPGDAARVAPVGVSVTSTELTVTPDPAMLSAPDLVFPLYIDPEVSATLNRWGYTNTGGHDQNDGVARVGRNPLCCGGVWRSYFEFDLTPLPNKFVYGARFYIEATHTSPCAATPVNLWATGSMEPWVNGTRNAWAPEMGSWADEKWVEANAGCGDQSPVLVEFGHNLFYHVRWRTDRALPNITLGLATYDQSGFGEAVDYWKKFDPTTARLVIWYNTHPGRPAAQPFNATTDCYKVCASATASSTSSTQAQGWWKLNETSGSTAADSASPPHPATAAGSWSWSDSAVAFTGGGDLRTGGPVLDTTKSFSVSAWAKLTSTGGHHTIVSQDANTVSGFHLRFDLQKQRWVFLRHAADDGSSERYYAESPAPVVLNTWVHLVGVYVNQDREKSVTLYLNGVRQSTAWAEHTFASAGALVIGRAKWAGAPSDRFAGGIDNVQVYQRQLEDSDVTMLYQAGRNGGALSISPALVRTTTPQIRFKPMDPDSHAVLWSDLEIRTAPSETGTLVHAQGGLGGGSQSGTVISFAVPSGKFTNGTTYYWRTRSVDELGWFGFFSSFHAVKVDTSPPGSGSPPVASSQYPEKAWGETVGVAGGFTFRASSDTAEYEWRVDGGSVFTVNAVNGTASVSYTPATDMVHTLRVKPKDLAGNVGGHYDYQFWVKPRPNRCWNWRMDELSGSTAFDRGNSDAADRICLPLDASVSAMNATVSGNTAWSAGHVNGALALNAAGARAVTPGPVLDTAQSFTVMAWVKPANLDSHPVQTVLSQQGQTTGGFELQYRKDANAGLGGYCLSMRASDSAAAAQTSACATARPANGTWAHVAGVYDRVAGKIRVYVNGDPSECGGRWKELAFTTPWTAGGPFVVGQPAYAPVEQWIGAVDDVYAFPAVLRAEDICARARL